MEANLAAIVTRYCDVCGAKLDLEQLIAQVRQTGKHLKCRCGECGRGDNRHGYWLLAQSPARLDMRSLAWYNLDYYVVPQFEFSFNSLIKTTMTLPISHLWHWILSPESAQCLIPFRLPAPPSSFLTLETETRWRLKGTFLSLID